MIAKGAAFLFPLLCISSESIAISSTLPVATEAVQEISALQKKILYPPEGQSAKNVPPEGDISPVSGTNTEFRKNGAGRGNNAPTGGIRTGKGKIRGTPSAKGDSLRRNTRMEMLEKVSNNWKICGIGNGEGIKITGEAPTAHTSCDSLVDRIGRIVIPRVRFLGTPLSNVVEMLASMAEKNEDPEHGNYSEINFVLLGTNFSGEEPKVTLNLRNISLHRLIEFVAKSVGYKFDVGVDAVIFYRSDMAGDVIETRIFPLPRATLVRLTSAQGILRGGSGESNNSEPIADEEVEIKNFFQRAGVGFRDIPGSDLAFDGTQIIVTNTCGNLKKIGDILKKYSEVKQVEIEARFIEVKQGVLDELGFNWQLLNRKNSGVEFFQTWQNGSDNSTKNLRTLAGAFAGKDFSMGDGKIVSVAPPLTTPIPGNSPGLPGQMNVGISSIPLANFTGVLNSLQCNVMIQALEQHSGSDLMSAPKLTVLSGKTAQITIAMELRYPQKYGDTRSEVGTTSGGIGSGGAAGVTITSGTPQDFTTRNVGVEMKVTPTVEADGSISLQLEPKVTEFEGFVEYWGMSIATNSQTTVFVPSGFFQPIFSTRKIRTEVNVFDGATVVMGGLTREEVREVNDKVPILGNLPLIGRLFQSKSESTQKRNLLIFITAHTISPAGEKRVIAEKK